MVSPELRNIEESIDAAKSEALKIVDQMLSQMKKSKNRSSDDEVTYTIKVTVKIEDE